MRSNFSFLAEHSLLLAELGATAEKLSPFDPASREVGQCSAESHFFVLRVSGYRLATKLCLRRPPRSPAARCPNRRQSPPPALLAKAFRGELVPQDPNDEPAAELLRRLAASAPATPKKRGRTAKAA